MNKNILFIFCFLSGNMYAISIKDKIVDLRKALAVHSHSEMDSWNKLEEIDKRLAALEARLLAQPQLPSYPHTMNTQDMCQPQEQTEKHTRCKRYKRKMQRRLEEAHIQNTKDQEQLSYFQEKAAYLNSLLANVRSYIQKLPSTLADITPSASIEPETPKKRGRIRCRANRLPNQSPTVTIQKSRKWFNRRPI